MSSGLVEFYIAEFWIVKIKVHFDVQLILWLKLTVW